MLAKQTSYVFNPELFPFIFIFNFFPRAFCFLAFFFFFEAKSPVAEAGLSAQDDLELLTLILLSPPEHGNHRYAPPCLSYRVLTILTQDFLACQPCYNESSLKKKKKTNFGLCIRVCVRVQLKPEEDICLLVLELQAVVSHLT